ncbi:SMC-Scp complex subunit ScpB [Clostridium tunisiense]|uniref:SMC-Scp complex subunit ScpB n=1 Tax=Clostridium tunisiense TaxID=219748 RepID=UPI000315F847|nr:SMC-Scp complex subunit ScpB [Clostridium tunisiense]
MDEVTLEQLEIEDTSYKNVYYSIIESLLFTSGDPLHINTIASIIEGSIEFTEKLMDDLTKDLEEDKSRGVRIINTNSEYQMVTKPANSEHIQKLLKTNIRQSLSRAALETLAIIAYKQPITRVEIEEIRGVKSDRAITTLVEKSLIKEIGKKEVVGRPNLYSTTDEFLKHFNFNNLDQLPSLEDFVKDIDMDNETL